MSERALVVYESIYGNTRAVAEAIAEGIGDGADARPPGEVDAATLDGADLLVVGGPTHMHGLTSSMSRSMAAKAAEEESDVELDPAATAGPGLREWLSGLSNAGARAAAFDTRIDRSPTLTGTAARGIAKRLRRRGYELIAVPESFFVDDSEGPLAEGELERARRWGQALAENPSSRA